MGPEKKSAGSSGNPKLMPLVEPLLQEPFAQQNRFAELTIEEVGRELEECRERMEISGEGAALKDSYERCVNFYCEILMAVEGSRTPTQTLAALAGATPVATTAPPPMQFTAAAPPLGLESPPTSAANGPGESDLSVSLTSTLAKEHLQFAHYFDSLADAEPGPGVIPLPKHHLARLTDQSLCHCVEAECIDRLQRVLARFWPVREAATRILLDTKAKTLDLHASLKSELDNLASQHAGLLYEGKFPYAAMLSSVRYLLATARHEIYQGSLLDYAVLLFLFGRDVELGTLRVKNYLYVTGVSAAELNETFFRLARLYKLRNRLVSATNQLKAEERATLQEDVQATILLLTRMRFLIAEGSKEVA